MKRFGVNRPDVVQIQSSYNVAPGEYVYVIANNKSLDLQAFQFGFTPSGADKKKYYYNARAEGDFNKENDPNYSGELGITKKKAFGIAIRSKRCLFIANGYIEGPKKERLNKPYHISRKEGEVFCFAGIWDTWVDKKTGEVTNSFSIITTVTNSITHEIGHQRSPVILDKKDEQKWLDDKLPLDDVLSFLKPWRGDEFKAEPVSIIIKDKNNKGAEVIIPIDPNNPTEYGLSVKKDLKLQGMGQNKRKQEPPPTQWSLF